ncbi:hypothetical protein U1Q18_038847 [Sarracenia purpurea var. burkii]
MAFGASRDVGLDRNGRVPKAELPTEWVRIIKVPDQPVLEDIGGEAKDKAVEDLNLSQLILATQIGFSYLARSWLSTKRQSYSNNCKGTLKC